MDSWEPVDIDKVADEEGKWSDDLMNDLEIRFKVHITPI